jgi:hypothetical protein
MLLQKKIKGRKLLLPDVSNGPYNCIVSQPGRPQSEQIKGFVVDHRHETLSEKDRNCFL